MPFAEYDLRDHMEPKDSYRAYDPPQNMYEVFSLFIFATSYLEESLHIAIRYLIEYDDENVLRRLIGQPRLSDLMPLLCDLARLKHPALFDDNDLRELISTARYIFEVRNFVAHRAPAWRDEWVRYDRYQVAKSIARRPELLYVCRFDELENLTDYTRLIAGELAWFRNLKDVPEDKRPVPMLVSARAFFNEKMLPPRPS